MNIKKAKLIKLKTDNGFFEMWEHVPLGKEYFVDAGDIRTENMVNKPTGKLFQCEIVTVIAKGLVDWHAVGFIPTEMVEIEK